jgi:hypothetical protein
MRVAARAGWLALGVVAAASGAACEKNDPAQPVAAVSLALSRTRVTLGSPIDLTYTFVPRAPIAGDYKVFLHVLDEDGLQMPWAEDHLPPVPTSQWKPGERVQYTRTLFVPLYPYLGEATVRVGLYRDGDRLPLEGPESIDNGAPGREYKVATLQLLASTENVFLQFTSGWHPAEFADDNPLRQWQWTRKTAVLSFKNPRRDVRLYLEYDARRDLFGDKPQEVTIAVQGAPVTTFTASNTDSQLRRIDIAAAELGTEDLTELRIEVDRPFVPAVITPGARDTRELGIRVYHVFVEPRDAGR